MRLKCYNAHMKTQAKIIDHTGRGVLEFGYKNKDADLVEIVSDIADSAMISD